MSREGQERSTRPRPAVEEPRALGCVLVLLLTTFARAHEGPPYPVIVDESHGPWLVTVWADPDVGLATFWVELETDATHRAPDDTRVRVSAVPSEGRLAPVVVDGEPETWSRGLKHVARIELPTREFWTIGVELESASTGASARTSVNVEVTPPGYGTLDLLLYSWPFVALGALWIGAMRRRARETALETGHPASHDA